MVGHSLRNAALLGLILAWLTGLCPGSSAEEPASEGQTAVSTLTRAEVEQRLQEKTTLELHDVPLADAVDIIATEHRLPMFLDRSALLDAGIDGAAPLSANYRNVSLGKALELMLREWDLTFVVGEGAVLITTREEAEQRIEPRVYSVYDLVEVPDWLVPPGTRPAGGADVDFDSLIALLTRTVHSESWDAVGGPGTLRELRPDLLVVTQTGEVHQEIADLLETLRRVPPAGEQKPNYREPEATVHQVGPSLHVGGESEDYSRIRSKLNAPTAIEMFDVPLADAMQEIGRLHDLPILIDRPSLADAGVDAGMPITAQYRGVRLRDALDYLLDEYDLTYLIDDEVLLITTPEEAEMRLTLRVYPVIDLVRMRAGEGERLSMDFDSLVSLLQSSVDYTTWDEVGGPGSLSPFPQRAALVVRQTQRTQAEIEDLLTELRRKRAAGDEPDIAARPAGENVVTQAYKLTFEESELSAASQQSLRVLIQQTVRPDSWGNVDDQERFITFLPGRIVVHNRHDVQDEVRALLLRLGLIELSGQLGHGGLQGHPTGGGFFRADPEGGH